MTPGCTYCYQPKGKTTKKPFTNILSKWRLKGKTMQLQRNKTLFKAFDQQWILICPSHCLINLWYGIDKNLIKLYTWDRLQCILHIINISKGHNSLKKSWSALNLNVVGDIDDISFIQKMSCIVHMKAPYTCIINITRGITL